MYIQLISGEVEDFKIIGQHNYKLALFDFNANKDIATTDVLSNEQIVNLDLYSAEIENLIETTLGKEALNLAKNGAKYGETREIHGLSYELQGVVSKWYYILRTIALVGMMSVLVYIGIRILLSSTSAQKAKYKELLQSWLIGMILLFTMHYIMSFSNIFVKQLNKIFETAQYPQYANEVEYKEEYEEAFNAQEIYIVDKPEQHSSQNGEIYVGKTTSQDEDGNEHHYITWFADSLGTARMQAELSKAEGNSNYIGYTIIYIVLIIYLLVFCWTYIKRVIYMAFLTIIAPLVALTYPIDKVNDGTAQGFNYWFKEYMFNLLLQPVHLLLYVVLVSSAIDLAQTNMIYSLVALGFIVTAEKIVREMFNFTKARTPGVFAGPAGAALTFAGMRKLLGIGPRGGSRGKGESSDKQDDTKGATYVGPKTKIGGGLGGLLDGISSNETETNGIFRDELAPQITNVEENGEVGATSEGNSVNRHSLMDVYSKQIMSNKKRAAMENLLARKKSLPNSDPISVKRLENALAEDDKWRNRQQKIKGIKGQPQLSSNNKPKESPYEFRRYTARQFKALKNGVSTYAMAKKDKLKRSLKNGKPIKRLARTAVGFAGGTLAGVAALSAGITSGDASKASQYAAAGAIGGYNQSRNLYDGASNNLYVEEAAAAYKRTSYGEDYEKVQAEKYAKEYAKRKEVIEKMYSIDPNISSWKEAQRKAQELANKYGVTEGIYDADQWKKLEKFQEKKAAGHNRNYTDKEGIAASKMYNMLKGQDDIDKAIRDNFPNLTASQRTRYKQVFQDWSSIENSI